LDFRGKSGRINCKLFINNMNNIIEHIAIIPDGNRRWAKKKGLSPEEGHLIGFERTKDIIKIAFHNNVQNISFWGSSINNLTKRPLNEVANLYFGFKKYFKEILQYKEIHDNKVQINVLGNWKKLFPKDLVKVIQKSIDETKHYTKYKLNFLLGYNGDEEMIQAIQNIVNKTKENKDLVINSDLIKQNLYTKDLPAVDLLIRTGGEPHNSVGFMMWDTANSQYYFTDLCYPDFNENEFKKAIQEYHSRELRQGK